MREHDVTTPDGRIVRVREDGDPGGVPLIVHHGTPDGRHLIRIAIEDARAQGIRLVAFDRAGYGASTRRPGRSVADVADDVAAIADALGIGRFATVGGSGGGPHALACAALLGDRVAATVTIAGVVPGDADGIDWTAGMGDDNVEEFELAQQGAAALRPFVERMRAEMLAGDVDQMVEALRSLLSPVDAAVLTGELAREMQEATALALAPGTDGWLDDDLAFVRDWGFGPEDVAGPVLLWHGRQDRFVPVAHGEWLAARIPGVDARIDADEGHLSIGVRRLGDVHAWVRERFASAG